MGGEVIAALDGVSLRIDRGEFVAVVGSSGSGKSTLMNIIGCLDVPTAGTYKLRGTDVRDLTDDALSALRNREIGFIFQNFQLLPRMSALKNVELPLVYRDVPVRERRELARVALERVGLGRRTAHKPGELSGGQRQRVSIARALVAAPSLLLADEPTGNLDSATSDAVMQLFANLAAEGKTVLMVTHERDLTQYFTRSITLSDGRLVANGEVK
jgi:putative ABC transport system ATP-binding protein